MRTLEVPVLIVGAGPSGVMAALLLERMGIETWVVETRPGPQRAPAAHVVNARSFEVFRAAGVDMQRIGEACLDPAEAGHVHWVMQLGGPALGTLPFEQQADDQLAVTPHPLRNLSQNRLEPLLVETLEDAGGRIQWQCRWESLVQDPDGVRSTLHDIEHDEPIEVRSRFVLAADGAGSRIRKQHGIALEGPDRLQSFIMIHLRANVRSLAGEPPGVLQFVCDPRTGGGAFIVHDPDQEAVYMHPFDPDTESPELYDEARCADIVRTALADPSFEFQIEHIGSWTMTAQVAERYRDDRVFLVGDAAHRFPPTGGLGLNSGVQDAHNLAWKIAAVLQGWGGEALLETYQSERRPVAKENADQSLRNAMRLIEVPVALGLDPDPEVFARAIRQTLSNPEGEARVSDAIARQAEHFDMPGMQLGFRYTHGAIVEEATNEPDTPIDPRHFEPSGAPGHRLPHAWIRGDEKQRASLLDAVPLDGLLLIVGPAGEAWLDAAAALECDRLRCERVTRERVHDFDTWLRLAGISGEGALLVRPDQHVAWRAKDAAGGDPVERLRAALDITLGRSGP